MQPKLYFPLFISIALAGCSNTPKNIVYEKDTIKLKQDFLSGVASSPSPELPLGEKIQGVWTDGSDVNASFFIKGDTIGFIEQSPHKYQLKGDSLKIFYGDSIARAKISVRKDTLILDDGSDEGAVKYWRFKD